MERFDSDRKQEMEDDLEAFFQEPFQRPPIKMQTCFLESVRHPLVSSGYLDAIKEDKQVFLVIVQEMVHPACGANR